MPYVYLIVKGHKMKRIKCSINIAVKLLIGVRKLVLVLVWMVVGLSLLALNQISGSEYLEMTRDVMVAFLATNMGEHFAKTITEWGKTK